MDALKRKQNYDLLRANGFDSADATRFKNFTDEKIQKFIIAKQEADEILNQVHSTVNKTFEGIIKGILQ